MATVAQKLAIDGGTPVRTEPFPAWPIHDEREEKLLLEVLHSGDWGVITGKKVETFARQFAEFQQAKYGVCVPNGTQALELAMQALGVGPGDEVITTPYTFVATASAILKTGAKTVFVDINPDTYNLDPGKIEQAITERTKAIIPVHLGGQPADMDGVMEVARRHNLRVVEDACQAWGAEWNGRKVGAIGDLGTFSFQASKNITAGEGGMVVTNDRDLYNNCWSVHNVGRVPDGAWYHHEVLGSNLRMTEWQGAILLAQLERLPQHIPVREANARYLADALKDVEGVSATGEDPRVTQHARHLFMMRYNPDAFGGRSRNDFLAAFRAEGIKSCGAGYVPLTDSPAIRDTLAERFGPESVPDSSAFPNSQRAGAEEVRLTQQVLLGTERDMDDVVAAVRKIQAAWG